MIELLCTYGTCLKRRTDGHSLCSMHLYRKRNGKDMDAPDLRTVHPMVRLIEAARRLELARDKEWSKRARQSAWQQFDRAVKGFRTAQKGRAA